MLLVKSYLLFHLLPFQLQKMLQIQLIAKAAEERHKTSGAQGCGAESLSMRCCADMGAEGGLGIEVGEIALNDLTLDGVGVVRAPYLRAKAQHAQVKAVAAGRTALQKNVGSGFENSAQHIVKT